MLISFIKPLIQFGVICGLVCSGHMLVAQQEYQLTDQTPPPESAVAPQSPTPANGLTNPPVRQPDTETPVYLPSLFEELTGYTRGGQIPPDALVQTDPLVPPVVSADEAVQIVVETTFLSCDDADLSELYQHVDPNQFELAARAGNFHENLFADKLHDTSPNARAVFSEAKSAPATIGTVTESQYESLITWFKGGANRNILQLPTVTMFDGQSAVVTDANSRPFVVSVKVVKSEDGQTAVVPVIQLVENGTMMKIESNVVGDAVELASTIVINEIESVDIVTLHTTPAAGATLQVPHCKTRIVQLNASLNPAELILIDTGCSIGHQRRTEVTKWKLPVVGKRVSYELETVPSRMLLVFRARIIPPSVATPPDPSK